MASQNQSKSTFTLRIAPASTTPADHGSPAATVDLMAAYRNSRMAAQQSLSSMRGMSIGLRSTGSTSYYRRAA